MCPRYWSQVNLLNMGCQVLSFASLVRSLASFSRIWGGSEEMLMLSGSVKGHKVGGLYDMGWFSLSRCEECNGREGIGFCYWVVWVA